MIQMINSNFFRNFHEKVILSIFKNKVIYKIKIYKGKEMIWLF